MTALRKIPDVEFSVRDPETMSDKSLKLSGTLIEEDGSLRVRFPYSENDGSTRELTFLYPSRWVDEVFFGKGERTVKIVETLPAR